MKDYIIAETYIHLKIEADSKFKTSIVKLLESRIKTYGYDYFASNAEYVCIVEDGSLKTWIFVVSSIIIFYGDLRDGIDHIVNDARSFSEHVINDVKTEPEISNESIFRAERRLGIPGKIQRIYNESIYLQENYNDLSPNEVHERLEKLKSDIIGVCNTINEQEREPFLNGLPDIVREELPQKIPINPNLILNRYVIREDERRRAQVVVDIKSNRRK